MKLDYRTVHKKRNWIFYATKYNFSKQIKFVYKTLNLMKSFKINFQTFKNDINTPSIRAIQIQLQMAHISAQTSSQWLYVPRNNLHFHSSNRLNALHLLTFWKESTSSSAEYQDKVELWRENLVKSCIVIKYAFSHHLFGHLMRLSKITEKWPDRT